MSEFAWTLRGRCYLLGDDIPHADGVIPQQFIIDRETDPKVLMPHLFQLTDPEFIKKNLEHYLKTKCDEIVSQAEDIKPRKTQTVERVLNRAFTQVLFNGRQRIESTDVFIAMISEKRSWAHYYIQQANIDKDKFENKIKIFNSISDLVCHI